MNLRQSAMLRHIAHSPRGREAFTGADSMGLSSKIAQVYLDDLRDEGYIECDERGIYSITALGVAHLESNREPVPSRQWGAWSTPAASYVPPTWQSTRPGADDHRQYRSLSGGC